MLLCMRCGTMNDPKENYCVNCGATMPKLAYTMEMASVDEINDFYYKMASLASQILEGRITVSQFENQLTSQMEKQHSLEQEIRETDIDEKLWPEFEEEFEICFAGMDYINEGMETMLLFAEDEDSGHLDQGLELIKKGSHLVNKANRINRNRDKTQSHYADLQRMERSIEL